MRKKRVDGNPVTAFGDVQIVVMYRFLVYNDNRIGDVDKL